MSCNSCNNVETVNIADVAIDNLASLPDFFLAERDVMDESTGNVMRTPVRVPSGTLFPNASQDNVIGLEINNDTLDVPEFQVRAGFISSEPGASIMKYADKANKAAFLMLGKYTDNIMRVQNTGFINIPGGHRYILGATYYLGKDGEPVTDASVTGQRLFTPVSNTRLAVQMSY